jgi:hypothetical protein
VRKVVPVILLIFIATYADFSDNGKNEIGGILAYSNSGNKYQRISLFQLSPFYNHYFNSNLAIGPIVSVSGAQGGSNTLMEIDLGLRATLGFKLNNSFLYLAPGVAFISVSDESAFGIPINLGIKTIIANHFGIDCSLGYTVVFAKYQTLNNFGIFIGIFGLI